MKVKLPDSFYFDEGSDFAVLLLHGFTGNTSDVRQLGRFLQKQKITSYAINYDGHAKPPEEILASSPHVWYSQAVEAYDFLKDQGYDKIFVAGVSIGGAFALRLASEREVSGLSTICSPMFVKDKDALIDSYRTYAKTFKQRFENKDEETINREIETSLKEAPTTLEDINTAISKGREVLGDIFVPVYVAQGTRDEVIDPGSADIIFNEVSTEDEEKRIKWYRNSGHVLTIDQDKNELFQDLYDFMTVHRDD